MSTHNLRGILSQATPEQWEAGINWYANARAQIDRLAVETWPIDVNYSLEEWTRYCAAIVAACSPQMPWVDNVRVAREFILNPNVKPKVLTKGVFERCVFLTKAVPYRYISSADISVKSHKTKRFFLNLVGDESKATIDTHAINAWHGSRQEEKVIKSTFSNARKRYEIIAKDYESLAGEYALTPAQLQAIVWVVWRSGNVKGQYNRERM